VIWKKPMNSFDKLQLSMRGNSNLATVNLSIH
jgi:hypothetical protein